jgi:hypothetical protein
MGWPEDRNNESITLKIADMHVHVHIHGESDAETFRHNVLNLLGAIKSETATIKTNTEKLMSSLDDDIALVQSQTTQIASIKTLITTLQQQIADALSGVTLPPAVQAKVDAVFAGLTQNSADLATALATGPTGTPLPTPTPAP